MNNLESVVQLVMDAYEHVFGVATANAERFELHVRKRLMREYCGGSKKTSTPLNVTYTPMGITTRVAGQSTTGVQFTNEPDTKVLLNG